MSGRQSGDAPGTARAEAASRAARFGRQAGLPTLFVLTLLALMLLVLIPVLLPLRQPPAHLGLQRQTIPAMKQWSPLPGTYTFRPSSRVVLARDYQQLLATTGAVFAEDLRALTGASTRSAPGGTADLRAGDLYMTFDRPAKSLSEEGYSLHVSAVLTISASTEAGVFQGTRSVLQLLRQGRSISGGVAHDWPSYPERALMVDIGPKFFSLSWLKDRVREISYLKLNQLHLHLSDDVAFRLESHSHPDIVALEHYTAEGMRDLVELASQYHVTIVPEIDMPGHMAAILDSHPDLQLADASGARHSGDIDLSQDAAYTFMRDIIVETVQMFPGPYWHLGGDEYISQAEIGAYPRLTAYAQARYGSVAQARDAYYGFLNWADDLVRSKGKTLRIWNDQLFSGGTVELNSDIVIDYWGDRSGLSAKELVDHGHRLLNSDEKYLYYILGGPHPDPQQIYEHFMAPRFAGGTTVDAQDSHLLGAQLAIWADKPETESQDQIARGVTVPLRALAQLDWGSESQVRSYADFRSLSGRIGEAPGPASG